MFNKELLFPISHSRKPSPQRSLGFHLSTTTKNADSKVFFSKRKSRQSSKLIACEETNDSNDTTYSND